LENTIGYLLGPAHFNYAAQLANQA
jgi:hypothetical protein